MKDFIQPSAFIITMILPFLLIPKWRHWGLLTSVLFGWIVVFVCCYAFPFADKTEAVFTGLWLAAGWLIMLVWCLPIYFSALIYRSLRKRK